MAIMQLTLIECLMCASYSRTQTLIAFLYIKKDCPQGDSLKEYSFHHFNSCLKCSPLILRVVPWQPCKSGSVYFLWEIKELGGNFFKFWQPATSSTTLISPILTSRA